MYGILAEDKSDVATLRIFIKKLANDDSITINKGYGSCGEMLKKGRIQLDLFAKLDYKYLIICYDSDNEEPQKRYQEVVSKIVQKTNLKNQIICILIPVQEIEAWILADIEAVQNIFKNWQPKPIHNPESISNPKEYLEKLSRDAKISL